MSIVAVAEEVGEIQPPQIIEIDGRTYERFEKIIQMPLTNEGALNAIRYALKKGVLRRNTVTGTTDLRGSKVGFTNQIFSQKGTRFSYETGASLTEVPAWGYVLQGEEIDSVLSATDDPYKSGHGTGNICRIFESDVVAISKLVAWMWVSGYPVQVWQYAESKDGIEAVNGFVLQGQKTLKSHINRVSVATTTETTTETTDWTIPEVQSEEEETEEQQEEQEEQQEETTGWTIGTSPSQDYGFGGQVGNGFGI
jgi:hypothetical protein